MNGVVLKMERTCTAESVNQSLGNFLKDLDG